jgi:hypothetical protein
MAPIGLYVNRRLFFQLLSFIRFITNVILEIYCTLNGIAYLRYSYEYNYITVDQFFLIHYRGSTLRAL